MRIKSVVLLLATITLGACGNQDEKVGQLQKDISDLRDTVTRVQTDLFALKLNSNPFESATFDPAGGKGYGRVDSANGTFLISLENVQPYLDGVRITLEVGNIQSATYNGSVIETTYGRRFPVYSKDMPAEGMKKQYTDYSAKRKDKKVTFTEVLRPGTWNRVSMVLPAIDPKEFGELEIKLKTDQVQLSRTRQ